MKLAAALLALAAPCAAAEADIRLRDAPGRAAVQSHCAVCHSLDYIQMNAPIQDRAGWQATVDKMIRAMGAPVKPEVVPQILDYLDAQYGKTPPQ